MNDKSKTKLKKKHRPHIRQTDVPSISLHQAIRIPQAIADNYASKPTTPLNVAAALDIQPTSGPFKTLCGASIAYGLTIGGYNASEIEITPLGLRIVRPMEEGQDLAARCEAILKPRVLGEFLNKYSGSPLPKENIAINVLEEMGVPRERAQDVLQLIIESAESVGFLKTIKTKKYVDLSGTTLSDKEMVDEVVKDKESKDIPKFDLGVKATQETIIEPQKVDQFNSRKRRVFVTHGKNKSLLDPIKKLLSFGELIPIISVEKQTVSKPVPEKVMADMRSCGAAIIHVDAERILMDKEANEHILLNENVLIEIGASMALYGQRFILLVKEGIQLPSNLHGLYEVRYKGNELDGDATIKLLEAINDIKNYSLPNKK